MPECPPHPGLPIATIPSAVPCQPTNQPLAPSAENSPLEKKRPTGVRVALEMGFLGAGWADSQRSNADCCRNWHCAPDFPISLQDRTGEGAKMGI